jgi:hypothetical protein
VPPAGASGARSYTRSLRRVDPALNRAGCAAGAMPPLRYGRSVAVVLIVIRVVEGYVTACIVGIYAYSLA